MRMDAQVETDKCTRGPAVGGVRAVGEVADYRRVFMAD